MRSLNAQSKLLFDSFGFARRGACDARRCSLKGECACVGAVEEFLASDEASRNRVDSDLANVDSVASGFWRDGEIEQDGDAVAEDVRSVYLAPVNFIGSGPFGAFLDDG